MDQLNVDTFFVVPMFRCAIGYNWWVKFVLISPPTNPAEVTDSCLHTPGILCRFWRTWSLKVTNSFV